MRLVKHLPIEVNDTCLGRLHKLNHLSRPNHFGLIRGQVFLNGDDLGGVNGHFSIDPLLFCLLNFLLETKFIAEVCVDRINRQNARIPGGIKSKIARHGKGREIAPFI